MSDNYRQIMTESSHIAGGNAAYVDGLYETYLKNPRSVPDEWQQYFKSLEQEDSAQQKDVSHQDIRDYFVHLAKQPNRLAAAQTSADVPMALKQAHVMQLINSFRLHGHHQANLDPLGLATRKHIPDLELTYHRLTDADLQTVFSTESPLTQNGAKLADIYTALQRTYSDSIGVEYMHITDKDETDWIQQQFESVQSHPKISTDEKINILKQLTAAEGLEKYLGSKYVGQKRFSLEGGDSLIPMMTALIENAAGNQVREVIIGMAHRGRLNMLINILGKAPEELFQEFEGKKAGELTGDVKYHMGFSSDVRTSKGTLHLTLAFNPSHLEIIAPVVEGSTRSRQRRRNDLKNKEQVVPVIIHGDAAFAGQGVVMETFNFSQARGYATGGTVHIVINNQIGFTTSNPLDARSTLYCTDVAKIVQAPIFHVNGDDPEAVIFVTNVALAFRMKFKRDVVIDLVCYRRHGHNEADEPSVTQPQMYEAVRALATPRALYAEKLIAEKAITKEQAEAFVFEYRDALDDGQTLIKTVDGDYEGRHVVDWTPFLNKDWHEPVDTRIAKKRLVELSKRLTSLPEDFTPHPVAKRLYDERNKMIVNETSLNWGCAEILAYATLLTEGYNIRLSGQDCGRGTFAHRHAVLHDYKTGETYIPLEHVASDQADIVVIDSVLSEEAVLAFEYGYATAEPNAMVIWEAQFGDFANGAQVVFDQFISSGEQKWGRLCGLTMFLPHGFEGQGPEHSSARLERFLQLCAQHNMQVCVPTTPSQIYHLIRRQMVRKFRKPLVVMTPKSLLRHKLATSTLEDLANGAFQNIISEIDDIKANDVRKVVLCSGRVYYDLLERRRKNKQQDIAIIRIEQLYPFPKDEYRAVIKQYKNAKEIVWCQEEPQNQGAWYSSQHHFRAALLKDQTLLYAGRDHFAAPAVGSMALHLEQQQQLVDDALK